jgi:hypothetical protein
MGQMDEGIVPPSNTAADLRECDASGLLSGWFVVEPLTLERTASVGRTERGRIVSRDPMA